jgi:hypothetical protein
MCIRDSYGEDWIAAHARPAPGFVMIYSNVCYAPGAGEGSIPRSTRDEAVQRAGGYSRTPLAMGASAVFATDFYAGAASIVDGLLARPDLPYGALFAADPRFDSDGLDAMPHPYAAGSELWLHRTAYFDGKLDYWYAFAGDPAATFAGGRSGGLYSSAVAFASPRQAVLAAGEHSALRLAAEGLVAESRSLTIDQPTSVTVSARGPLEGQAGVWLSVSEGELAGWAIAESAAAYLPGIGASHQLLPRRYVAFAAGTHAGHRFDESGAVVASKVGTLGQASRARADAEAIVNGQHYLHLGDGAWKDYWVLATEAARLGAPEPVTPPVAVDPPPASSLAPEPSLAAPPDTPARPASTPTASPTTPAPTPSGSTRATTSPSAPPPSSGTLTPLPSTAPSASAAAATAPSIPTATPASSATTSATPSPSAGAP